MSGGEEWSLVYDMQHASQCMVRKEYAKPCHGGGGGQEAAVLSASLCPASTASALTDAAATRTSSGGLPRLLEMPALVAPAVDSDAQYTVTLRA